MVVIVGGGISGLSAAFELATRRVPFILLEASDRTGGLVRTERVNGFTIDSGADSMLAAKPAAVQLCEELGLGHRLMTSTPPRTAYVHARGRLYPLPSPSIFGIPTTPSAIAGYDLLPEPARRELAARASGSGLDFLARPNGRAARENRDLTPETNRSRISTVATLVPRPSGSSRSRSSAASMPATSSGFRSGPWRRGSCRPRAAAACSLRRRRAPARATVPVSSERSVAAWASSWPRSKAGCLREVCEC